MLLKSFEPSNAPFDSNQGEHGRGKLCFQTGFIPSAEIPPKKILREPQPLNPGCRSSHNPLHSESFAHKRAASHPFTKYKLWSLTVWAWAVMSRLDCRPYLIITALDLLPRWARLIFQWGCCRLTSISRWAAGNQPGRGRIIPVCMRASHTSVNTEECKCSGVVATDGDLAKLVEGWRRGIALHRWWWWWRRKANVLSCLSVRFPRVTRLYPRTRLSNNVSKQFD